MSQKQQEEDVLIRPWEYTQKDIKAFYKMFSNPNVSILLRLGHTDNIGEAALNISFLAPKDKGESVDDFAIVRESDGAVVGRIGLIEDLHGYEKKVGKNIGNSCLAAVYYGVAEEYWGNGYAGKALKKLQKEVFENRKEELLIAYHVSMNKNSRRVLEKAGFQYDNSFIAADGRTLLGHSFSRKYYFEQQRKESQNNSFLKSLPQNLISKIKDVWNNTF